MKLKALAFFFLLFYLFHAHAKDNQQMMKFGDTTRLGIPFAKDPHVIKFKGKYLLYYSIPPKKSDSSSGWGIGVAQSNNLRNWIKVGEITPDSRFAYESKGICAPCVLVIKQKVHLFYQTYGNRKKDAICHATSFNGIEFKRDDTNPIFSASGDWNCGREIDAEVIRFKGNYLMYFATRDTSYKQQIMGVAITPGKSTFKRNEWKQICNWRILPLEFNWEGNCTEGPSVIKRNGRLYLFYAANYNNLPQQIGVAESLDGLKWKKLSDKPFLSNGKPGEWNSSESGHPHIFDDGRKTYLFYQGNNDNGKTWFISCIDVLWNKQGPILGL